MLQETIDQVVTAGFRILDAEIVDAGGFTRIAYYKGDEPTRHAKIWHGYWEAGEWHPAALAAPLDL